MPTLFSRSTLAWLLLIGALALFPWLATVAGQDFYIGVVIRIMIFAIAASSLNRILGYGGMVSFELKNAAKPEVFAFLDRLQMVVKATSLGDVHTMVLHPWIASHRDVPPKQKERMGLRENLVRFSVGIEALEDIIADVQQALA